MPRLTGAAFGRANRRLADKGLAVAYDGGGLPPGDARVTASDPPAGTGLRFGEYVTLSVAVESPGASGGATTPPASGSQSGSPQPTHGPSTSSPSTSTAPPAWGAHGPVYGPLGGHRGPGSAFADTATMQRRDSRCSVSPGWEPM